MSGKECLSSVSMLRPFVEGPKSGQGQESHAANLVPNWDLGKDKVRSR